MLRVKILVFFLLMTSFRVSGGETSWTAVLNQKADVMDVDAYEVVILDPGFYIRVFPFLERGKIPIARIDLKGVNVADPLVLKSLIEEKIPEVLFKRFLGICFINPHPDKKNEGVAALFASVHYHYPEVKLTALYDSSTIDAIAPYISYLIVEQKPEGYNGDLLLLRKGEKMEGML